MFKAYLIEEDKVINLLNLVNTRNTIVFRDENDRLNVVGMNKVKLLQNTGITDVLGNFIYQGDVISEKINDSFMLLRLLDFKVFNIKDKIKSGFCEISNKNLYLKNSYEEDTNNIIGYEYFIVRNHKPISITLNEEQINRLNIDGICKLGNIYENENLRTIFPIEEVV